MALSFATVGVLPAKNDAGFDIQSYLMHSLTTAGLARMLCQKFDDGATDPSDCHIAGLLHDFGKVVFAQFMPAEFQQALTLSRENCISLHAAEEQIIGADHSIVGAMLAEKWQLSNLLSSAIRNHHGDILPNNTMQSCLFVANLISNKLSLGNSGNAVVEEMPPGLIKRFGGNIDEIIAQLGDISKVVIEAESYANVNKEVNT